MQRGHTELLTMPPEHLVDRPARTGWRRIGVGTAPFNFVSFMLLVAISSFIVRTPTTDDVSRISQVRERQAAAAEGRARAAASEARAAAAAVARENAKIAHIDTPMQVVTLSEAAAVPVPDAADDSSPRKATKPYTPPKTPAPPKPAPPKPPSCDDYASQPAAQAAFDANRAGLAPLDGDGDGIACEQLPGRTTQPPSPQIPTVAELRKPYTRLYGVHTPNAPYRTSEITDFATAAGGKFPNTLMFFQNFSQEFPAEAVDKSWAAGALPMITFEPIVQDSPAGQPTLADITGGKWDTYLQTWAAAAKTKGSPFALRFAQEMNGDWYPWSDGKLGNKRGDFVLAWRHVHDLFDRAGVTNVLWVWSVNRVDNLYDKTLARVYPGDKYVDWVGISGYYRRAVAGVAPSFDGTFLATLNELKKTAPGKLVMLTEVGAETSLANRTAWITSFFAGLLDHPEILGFSWFNDFKDGDWRIQYAQATAAAFAKGVADLRYGSLVYQAEPAPSSPAATATPGAMAGATAQQGADQTVPAPDAPSGNPATKPLAAAAVVSQTIPLVRKRRAAARR